jgi:peptide/nickel transport system permease protein
MGKYILKRILLLIPTFLLVCIIVFALMRMIPGDAVDSMVTKLANAGVSADRASIEATLGLDQPAVKQFFTWIAKVVRGDLGDSIFQYESVSSILSRKLPVTLELGILTVLLSCVISIPCGLLCAARQDSLADHSLRVVSILLLSIPVFWIATIVLIYPAVWWGYSPPVSYVSFFKDPGTNLRMVLPAALLGAFGQAGMQLRMVRTVTLDVMRQDYVRTGWSKGLTERKVVLKYAFRNAMIPVITQIGGSIASLVGGSVVLENIFSIPGMGQVVVEALNSRDYPLVQGCVIVFALFVMVVNLVVDVAYKWVDPRVNLE